jgi:hypothetical protein
MTSKIGLTPAGLILQVARAIGLLGPFYFFRLLLVTKID